MNYRQLNACMSSATDGWLRGFEARQLQPRPDSRCTRLLTRLGKSFRGRANVHCEATHLRPVNFGDGPKNSAVDCTAVDGCFGQGTDIDLTWAARA